MRANDIAGVTVYAAFSATERTAASTRTSRCFTRTTARSCSRHRHQEKLRAFLPIVEQMVQEGLVVFSDVDIIKYAYRALETGTPAARGIS